MKRLSRIFSLCLLGASLSGLGTSCKTTQKAFKAKPAELSAFVEDRANVRLMGGDGPFHSVWDEASAAERRASAGQRDLYVAPVKLAYLRPISSGLAAWGQQARDRTRPAAEIAELIRSEFERAFRESEQARYRIVSQPSANGVTLELALVELDPTSVGGNLAKKAVSTFVNPGAMLAGRFTRGQIAIEGKLRDTSRRRLLFQFADREHDKMTLWNVQDFRPYGHARIAIREWARQFELVTRRSDWQEIKDSRIFRLRPF